MKKILSICLGLLLMASPVLADQTITGSFAINGNLRLQSTSSATKGQIYFGSLNTAYYDETLGVLVVPGLVSQGVYPDTTAIRYLGSGTKGWAGVYLGVGGVITGLDDADNTITSSASGWIFGNDVTAPGFNSTALDGFRGFWADSNTNRSPGVGENGIYWDANVFKVAMNGVEYTGVTEEIANVFTVKQEFDATTGLQVGSTGVLITSDNDGAITFLGKSAGSDEDLTLNLDDTANTVVVSSSTGVTDLNFSALKLVTTGTISGAIPMITKTEAYTLGTDSAQEAYGYMVWLTGDGTVLTLPAVVVGMSVCVYSADSYDKVVDSNASDGIRNGTTTRNADGHKITSGATDQGSFVCLVADSADGWTVLGKSGTWTDE